MRTESRWRWAPLTVQNWTDEVADALERLNVADTLEELRHHIDALIDRLGKQEPQSEQGSEVAAQPDGLDRQIDSLGRKVESASSMLAQLTDLLESQSERIETIEQQLGDPDGASRLTGQQPAAFAYGRETISRVPEPREQSGDVHASFEELRREIAGLRQQREWLDARLERLEAAIERLETTVGTVREMALQRESRVEFLEDRLLLMLEERLEERSGARVAGIDAETKRGEAMPPAAVPPPVPSAEAPRASPRAADREPAARLALDAPLDPATARRLEDLVEREIKLQHEFTPGAAAEKVGRAGRATVMVVDDSVDARTILSIYLSRTGYQVVTAASAEDCLAKLRHHAIDAIILDATMPGGGAEHFLRVVHGDPTYRDRAGIPVIVYTGHPEAMTRERARQLGATDYLVKGGDLLPLLTTLVRHLNPGAAAAAPPVPVQSRV